MNAADVVLSTSGLVKRFGDLTAVDRLDLEVRRGEVVGLLGPNGAGKSTTIGMILGLVRPNAGSARVMGHDVGTQRQAALAQLGAMLEVTSFYPYLSGRDNLMAIAILRGGAAASRVDPMLARIGLAQRARSKFRTYSLGMRQRLGIAATLLHDPAVVILDEPANGLDPAGQREIRDLIRELAKEGRGVLLTSHLLHEIEQVCDRVVVIQKGRVIASGPLETITRNEGYQIRVADLHAAAAVLRALSDVTVTESGDALDVVAAAGRGSELNRALAAHGIYAEAIVPRTSSLEDAFMELTAREATDASSAS